MKWYIWIIAFVLVIAVYVVAEDYNFYLTKSIADRLYCSLTGWCQEMDHMQIYVDNSMLSHVTWNVSDSEDAYYNFTVIAGAKLIPVGGKVQ